MKLITTCTGETDCCHRALPTMPCVKLLSQAWTANRLNPTSPKVGGTFNSPPGECDVCAGGGCPSRVCVGAINGSTACGCARLDAVDEKEMVQPLESVQVELC
jgi:hypothetical protein